MMMMILDLHRQGLSVSAIARESGIDRKMIRGNGQMALACARRPAPRKPQHGSARQSAEPSDEACTDMATDAKQHGEYAWRR
ncbi:hypothetical protein X728_26395 [Mesorhizobium sp. L103C120A0]|nr:hypothetical protein X728_26395 [Mesorhizobium sp. L103C120A0]